MITTMIPAFYARVLADPELAPFFKHATLEKLRTMQHEFFSMALGGPVSYTGRSLSHTHHGRGISKHHFGLFIGHLLETLLDIGVTKEETNEVINTINTYANEVTGTSY